MSVALPLEGRTGAALQISESTMTTTNKQTNNSNQKVSSNGTELSPGLKTQCGDDPTADLMMLSTQLIC